MKNHEEIIKQFYAGLNRNDVDAAIKLLDADIARTEFEDKQFHGHSELRDHISSGRNTWAEGACTPVEFISEGDKTVVIVQVKVRLKNETKWIEGVVADAFALKTGLITEFHSFMTKEKALEWLNN